MADTWISWISNKVWGSRGSSNPMSGKAPALESSRLPVRSLGRRSTLVYPHKEVPSNRVLFRVCGIPSGFAEREALISLLESALHVKRREAGLEIATIADGIAANELVATVSFDEIPTSLVPGERRCRFEGQKFELRIDAYFEGFTVLYSPEHSRDAYVDCISISGIGSHALGSFKKRDGTYVWLRDSLPTRIPGMRVITYGYRSFLDHSVTDKKVFDYGHDLVAQLADLQTGSRRQPRSIIFIAHSFGGIIVKEALAQMSRLKKGDPKRAALEATRGVMNFGVPNLGMNIKHLLPIIQGQVNQPFVESLNEGSKELARLDEASNQVVQIHGIQIFAFYETQKSSTAKKIRTDADTDAKRATKNVHTLTMTGDKELLVTRESATSGCPEDNRIPLDRSHSELVKFRGENDPDLEKVLERLELIVGNSKDLSML